MQNTNFPLAASLSTLIVVESALVATPAMAASKEKCYDHQLWGLMILINIVWGAGQISVDRLLKKRFLTRVNRP